jgi:hypothetical protein
LSIFYLNCRSNKKAKSIIVFLDTKSLNYINQDKGSPRRKILGITKGPL